MEELELVTELELLEELELLAITDVLDEVARLDPGVCFPPPLPPPQAIKLAAKHRIRD